MRHDSSAARGEEAAASWSASYATMVEKARVCQPVGSASEAELRVHCLGAMKLVRLRCGASSIHRASQEIGRNADPRFTVLLVAAGGAAVDHCGHHARLGEGDLILLGSGAPYDIRIEDGSELILLRVSAAVAREQLPTPDHFCGRRLAADQGLASMAAAMAKSLVSQLERELSAECREQAGRHLLAIAAGSFASSFDDLGSASSIMAGRHLRVKLYIEQHLRDPELSPSLIAERLRLSSRYLRMIFAGGNESPSAFILRRRLEECARQLGDPRWRGHSITEIAFSWGFNSAPHFTRSFRERFALSPRDYRQQQMARVAAPAPAPAKRTVATIAAVAA